MSREISSGNDARQKILNGVKALSDAVKVTMGPKGRNVLLERGMGTPIITKDGVTVALEVFQKDKLEDMGVKIVRQAATNTAEEAGDGTTTATVLASAIFSEGLKNVVAGSDPVSLNRGIKIAVGEILKKVKENSRVVDSSDDIKNIATISANSDKNIGLLISNAIEQIGNEGVITVEEAKGLDDELTIVRGTQFDRGYLSPYFVTNNEKMIVEMENPIVLITDQKISSLNDILPAMEEAQKQKKPILIIADDIDSEALSALVVNKMRGILDVAAVKAPSFGERRLSMLSDLAVILDGTVVSSETGTTSSSLQPDMLGRASKVTITQKNTTIIGGYGNKEKIEIRAKEIKAMLEQETNDFNKSKLQERIAQINGGVAVLKIGAASETEMKEKRDRVDDAIGATKSAIEEGIVIGGGSALVKATRDIVNSLDGDEKIGFDIVLKAVKEPMKQIAENAGVNGGVIVHKVTEIKSNSIGYNASVNGFEDLFEAGIIDPCKVTRTALENAASVAGILLTTEVAIFEDEDKTKEPDNPFGV